MADLMSAMTNVHFSFLVLSFHFFILAVVSEEVEVNGAKLQFLHLRCGCAGRYTRWPHHNVYLRASLYFAFGFPGHKAADQCSGLLGCNAVVIGAKLS